MVRSSAHFVRSLQLLFRTGTYFQTSNIIAHEATGDETKVLDDYIFPQSVFSVCILQPQIGLKYRLQIANCRPGAKRKYNKQKLKDGAYFC